MRSRHGWLLGTLIAMTASGVCASGTRINFSGAVVEPTCAFGSAQVAALRAAPESWGASQRRCGQSATDAGRSFTRHVREVDAAMATSHRLLAYFASLASLTADGRSAARLVVRTYD